MSSCALVLAPAGFPPVSAEMNSILRPASVLLFSLRKDAIPCSIWMPPWASGPVLTVKSPIRNGAACAMAGAKRNDAVATAPAAKARRLSLRAIGKPPRELESHPIHDPSDAHEFDDGIIYHRVRGCKVPLFAAARRVGKIACGEIANACSQFKRFWPRRAEKPDFLGYFICADGTAMFRRLPPHPTLPRLRGRVGWGKVPK